MRGIVRELLGDIQINLSASASEHNVITGAVWLSVEGIGQPPLALLSMRGIVRELLRDIQINLSVPVSEHNVIASAARLSEEGISQPPLTPPVHEGNCTRTPQRYTERPLSISFRTQRHSEHSERSVAISLLYYRCSVIKRLPQSATPPSQ